MAGHTERRRDPAYAFRFGASALVLVAGTLVLVLFVLPQRYVLSAGFRESGVGFPDPGTPFDPQSAMQVAARPAAPRTAASQAVARGPAEIFWARVIPLLEGGRYGEALPDFERYLQANPTDADVRREHALTLIAAGRLAEAIPVLEGLTSEDGDGDLRLLLARTLRDLGRMDAASAHYERLYRSAPGNVDLALEWARAWAWPAEYARAEAVLRTALRDAPGSGPIIVELARIYYYSDRLAESAALLEAMSEEDLRTAAALGLRADVRAAMAVPEEEVAEVVPPSLLERALAAREDDDFEGALALFERALAERPDDSEIWLAYANLLEYELSDFDGAREALGEAERLGASDPQLQFRIALLEAWTGHNPEAADRLAALQAALEAYAVSGPAVGPDDPPPVTVADVLALTGDLHRWDGDRLEAARRYDLALAADARNVRALDGLEAIRIEVALLIDQVEGPRTGTFARGLADTDDFERFDVGGEWIGVHDPWIWSGAVGNRWLGGRDLTATTTTRQGPFVEITPARWWRRGTIRTSVHVGAEWVRPGAADASVGAGLRHRSLAGATSDIEYRHEPAHAVATTLQSVDARLAMDRVVASHQRALGDRWSIAVATDVARLDPVGLTDAASSTRTQGSVSVSRAMTRIVSVGWSSLVAGYSAPAPAPGGVRLYWDPSTVVATGPHAQLRGNPGERWEASMRVSPGIALIDERGGPGFEGVPQLSAEARIEYAGARLRSAVDVFYSQARLEGYRIYGVRLSMSSTSWLSQDPSR